MFIAIIGDYSEHDMLKNSLYDIRRINLNSAAVFNSFKANGSHNPFEVYLRGNKKCLWSLESLDSLPYKSGSRRDLIIGYYMIAYALPGIVLLKQGDELEYEQKSPSSTKFYRWDDLKNHSGFSANFSENLFWSKFATKSTVEVNNQTTAYTNSTVRRPILHEFGLDVKFAQRDRNSLYNFLILMNRRVKPKLVDIRPENVFTTTMFPVIPKAPVNSTNSKRKKNAYNIHR